MLMVRDIFSMADKKIWVAGHNGMVGSAILRRLKTESCSVVTVGREELDLRDQSEVQSWMGDNKVDVVILAAAKVGGISANSNYPAEFIYDNIAIQNNVINGSYLAGVKKLVFLGSSCIYPKFSEQPIKEHYLLQGALEETNQWYAIAKIAGIKLCQAYRRQYNCDYISLQPTNLYGPGDNFDEHNSHVIPGLIRRLHDAKERQAKSVKIWGSGRPLREFLYVDDLADAVLFTIKKYSEEMPINVGSGKEISIAKLAELIQDITRYEGALNFDCLKPDGAPRKLLDISRLQSLGWRPKTCLVDGIKYTVESFSAGQEARVN